MDKTPMLTENERESVKINSYKTGSRGKEYDTDKIIDLTTYHLLKHAEPYYRQMGREEVLDWIEENYGWWDEYDEGWRAQKKKWQALKGEDK